MFNGYNQPLYESDPGRDIPLKKTSHAAPWAYGQPFFSNPDPQQPSAAPTWHPKPSYPSIGSKCACRQCQGSWYHKEPEPMQSNVGAQDMMLLGPAPAPSVSSDYPMDGYPRSDVYMRPKSQMPKPYQSCSYPTSNNASCVPQRVPPIKQPLPASEYKSFDRNSEQYMRMLESSGYPGRPVEQRPKYWDGVNGPYYPSQQYQYPSPCRYTPYNAPYYYQGAPGSQSYHHPQTQNGVQQYYGIHQNSIRQMEPRPQIPPAYMKPDNSSSKISPLRLMRKKKSTEPVCHPSPPRPLNPSESVSGPALDVRRFLATWADEDEDPQPQQMVVLDCQDINPEQAELLRLYEESAIRFIQEPTESPSTALEENLSGQTNLGSEMSVLSDLVKMSTSDPPVVQQQKPADNPDKKSEVEFYRNPVNSESQMSGELNEELSCSAHSPSGPPSVAPASPASQESLPALADLPTSEYRKNKFLDYDVQAFPMLPVAAAKEASEESVSGQPEPLPAPTPSDLSNQIKGKRKCKKRNRKPTIKFSIQKSHDLKISLRVMNESKSPAGEEDDEDEDGAVSGGAPEMTKENEEVNTSGTITVSLDDDSEKKLPKIKRARKMKKRRMLEEAYSVSSEDHFSDVTNDGFQVLDQSVNAAKIKLTLKRRKGDNEAGSEEWTREGKSKKKKKCKKEKETGEGDCAESTDGESTPAADTTTDCDGKPSVSPGESDPLDVRNTLSPLRPAQSSSTPEENNSNNSALKHEPDSSNERLQSVLLEHASNTSSPKITSSCHITSPRTSTDSIERELQAIWNGEIRENLKTELKEDIEVTSNTNAVDLCVNDNLTTTHAADKNDLNRDESEQYICPDLECNQNENNNKHDNSLNLQTMSATGVSSSPIISSNHADWLVKSLSPTNSYESSKETKLTCLDTLEENNKEGDTSVSADTVPIKGYSPDPQSNSLEENKIGFEDESVELRDLEGDKVPINYIPEYKETETKISDTCSLKVEERIELAEKMEPPEIISLPDTVVESSNAKIEEGHIKNEQPSVIVGKQIVMEEPLIELLNTCHEPEHEIDITAEPLDCVLEIAPPTNKNNSNENGSSTVESLVTNINEIAQMDPENSHLNLAPKTEPTVELPTAENDDNDLTMITRNEGLSSLADPMENESIPSKSPVNSEGTSLPELFETDATSNQTLLSKESETTHPVRDESKSEDKLPNFAPDTSSPTIDCKEEDSHRGFCLTKEVPTEIDEECQFSVTFSPDVEFSPKRKAIGPQTPPYEPPSSHSSYEFSNSSSGWSPIDRRKSIDHECSPSGNDEKSSSESLAKSQENHSLSLGINDSEECLQELESCELKCDNIAKRLVPEENIPSANASNQEDEKCIVEISTPEVNISQCSEDNKTNIESHACNKSIIQTAEDCLIEKSSSEDNLSSLNGENTKIDTLATDCAIKVSSPGMNGHEDNSFSPEEEVELEPKCLTTKSDCEDQENQISTDDVKGMIEPNKECNDYTAGSPPSEDQDFNDIILPTTNVKCISPMSSPTNEDNKIGGQSTEYCQSPQHNLNEEFQITCNDDQKMDKNLVTSDENDNFTDTVNEQAAASLEICQDNDSCNEEITEPNDLQLEMTDIVEELEEGEIIDDEDEYFVVEDDVPIVIQEALVIELSDDSQDDCVPDIDISDIPLPPGEPPEYSCFDLNKLRETKRLCAPELDVSERSHSPFPTETLELFRNPSPPGTPRLISPNQPQILQANEDNEDVPVSVTCPAEDAVPDDAEFQDVMENCLANAKRFLTRANDDEAPEIKEESKETGMSSKDVLLSSFEVPSDMELGGGVSSSEVSVDFSPFYTSLGPESLPVDNWPYLEEEVPLSPSWPKTEEDIPLVESEEIETRDFSEKAPEVSDDQKHISASKYRGLRAKVRRKTFDSFPTPYIARKAFSSERKRSDSDPEMELMKENENSSLKCCLSLDRLSSDENLRSRKCWWPRNVAKSAITSLAALKKRKPFFDKGEEFRCSKWQPKVILSRMTLRKRNKTAKSAEEVLHSVASLRSKKKVLSDNDRKKLKLTQEKISQSDIGNLSAVDDVKPIIQLPEKETPEENIPKVHKSPNNAEVLTKNRLGDVVPKEMIRKSSVKLKHKDIEVKEKVKHSAHNEVTIEKLRQNVKPEDNILLTSESMTKNAANSLVDLNQKCSPLSKCHANPKPDDVVCERKNQSPKKANHPIKVNDITQSKGTEKSVISDIGCKRKESLRKSKSLTEVNAEESQKILDPGKKPRISEGNKNMEVVAKDYRRKSKRNSSLSSGCSDDGSKRPSSECSNKSSARSSHSESGEHQKRKLRTSSASSGCSEDTPKKHNAIKECQKKSIRNLSISSVSSDDGFKKGSETENRVKISPDSNKVKNVECVNQQKPLSGKDTITKQSKVDIPNGLDERRVEDEANTENEPWVCSVCGFDDVRLQQKHVQEHSFHCQSCHLAFKSEDHFIGHLTMKHQDIRKMHHCLLCEESFDSERMYKKHILSKEHRHLESVEKNTIHTLFTLLLGEGCPVLGPVEPKPEWLPNQAGTVHFYHQATPLSLAVQYWKMKQNTAVSKP